MIPKIKITLERWKWNTQYNCYVSTEGRIMNINKNIVTPGCHKNYLHYHGYLVHRIVASTFLKDYSESLTVDHIDRNTRNNSVKNLRMMTKEENEKRALNENKLHSPIRPNVYPFVESPEEIMARLHIAAPHLFANQLCIDQPYNVPLHLYNKALNGFYNHRRFIKYCGVRFYLKKASSVL